MSKTIISIVYPHIFPVKKVFDTPKCDIWFGPPRPADVIISTDPYPADALLILEPPIVAPALYEPNLWTQYRKVFAFHTPQDITASHAVQFRYGVPPLWPELPERISERSFGERKNAVVAVMANKYPHREKELLGVIHQAYELGLGFGLYGYGWDGIPAWQGRLPGGAERKRDLLSNYRYCYCPENSNIQNYVTEKLPDAIAAGCVPIYGQKRMEYECFPWDFVDLTPGKLCEVQWNESREAFKEYWTQIRHDMSADRLWDIIAREYT